MPTAGTALFTGHITNSNTDTIAVSYRLNQFDSKEHITYAPVGPKGDFQLSVPVTGPTRADLVYGDAIADLYIDAGTDLDIRFKSDDMPGTIKFKANGIPNGFGAHVRNGSNLTDEQLHRLQMVNANTYLAEFDEQFVSNEGFQVLPENIMLYEAPFLSFLDYRLKHEEEFLEDHAAKQSFTADFYNYAKAEIIYSNANDRLTFPDLREQMVTSEGRLTMSPSYFAFLEVPGLLSDVSASKNEQYQEFLLNYVHHQVAAHNHKRTDADFMVVSYMVAAKRLSGDARLATLGRILQESFRFGHVQQSAAMLAEFAALDARKAYTAELQADFEQRRSLAIGAQAPDFELQSATGEVVKLSSFRGKLVYLNFWKTNNPLCLRDLPYAQDLSKRFEGKNVVFLNIALDEQESSWQKMVQTKPLAGVHLYAPGGTHSAVAAAYHITAAPSYMMLGEDGTILLTKPKGLGSRAAVEEISEAFGKAGTYAAALTLLSNTASATK